jgi:DNA-binding Xre family transcriptional regulator
MSPIRLRVREIREKKLMTQVELAKAAGIRRATLSALESGRTRGIDFHTLEALAVALQVDAGHLIVHERGGVRRAR